MRVQMDNFDLIDHLSVVISIYNINIKQIKWRKVKLQYNEMYLSTQDAHADRLCWPFRSIADLSIYLLYKFEWIWTKNKKVSFARFCVQIFKHTCTHVHAFSEKKWL
jgi:hypothetical protein